MHRTRKLYSKARKIGSIQLNSPKILEMWRRIGKTIFQTRFDRREGKMISEFDIG